ncbi:MAG: starch-binding protein [Prevotella sp.]|nr:starch-binding protein [Prevotella sp.]
MKRLTFLAMVFFAVLSASAQMIAYSVQTRVEGAPGTPTVIDLQGTTGTDFSKLLLDNDGNLNFNAAEDVTAFPIGFDFGYNSQQMKYFVIGSDGFIQLFPDETVTTSVHTLQGNLFNNADAHDVVGLVMRNGFYGYDDSEISYWTEGTEGSRALAVQWKNVGVRTNNNWEQDVCAKATVIVRLYENNGNIEIKVSGFKPYDDVAPGNYNFMRIGILGDASDRLMVRNFEGTDYTAQDQTISYTATAYPQDGTVYTFVAPEPCSAPLLAPSTIELTSTTTQISGTFEAVTADHYLVLATTDDELTEKPADKTKYAVGDEIGNARVIANVDRGEFYGPNDMSQGTWNIFVVAYNSLCMNGPLYGPVSEKATVAMKPAAPANLAVTFVDKTNITLKAEDSGAQMVIAMTDVVAKNPYDQILTYGAFGTPTGNYEVGQEIEGGGKVIYVGPSVDAVGVGDLTVGTPYFFRAWSTDGNGGYSSEYLDANTVTAAELPWAFDLDGAPIGETPFGWSQNDEDAGVWSQNERYGYFYNQVNAASAEAPAECWRETHDIYLDEGSNWLSVDIAATEIPVRFPTDWTMQEGDKVAIQVTTDGVEYKDIIAITKDNMPGDDGEGNAIWKNGEFYSFKVNFSDYAGQKAKVRLYINRQSKGQVQFKNLKIDGTLYGIVGTIPGLTWDDDLFMEQDADNKNIYTATLNVTVDEVPAEGYEYKLRANANWDGYQLPAEGNQTWTPAETGDYSLVFTADIVANTLTLTVERPFQVSFKNEERWGTVYAYTWIEDGDGNVIAEPSGAWPGTPVEATGGFFNRTWTYNFTSEHQPQYIIWSNGESGEDAAQTADLVFVNGKTYSVYPEITSVTINGSWNDWSGTEMTVTEYNDMAYQTTVNLKETTEDQEFKIVVNGTEWIGSGEFVTIEGDAAESVVEGEAGSNLTLKAGSAYDIVAFWSQPGTNVKEGWLLEVTENTTTDISGVRANVQKKTVYNTSGQRLNNTQRGVNIVGSKKVVVK